MKIRHPMGLRHPVYVLRKTRVDIYITQDLQKDKGVYTYTYLLHTIFRKIKVYALRKTRVDIYISQNLHKDNVIYIYICIYIYIYICCTRFSER